ncbi:SpoIIE family protein phosphatase [Oerskovia flava]|uniref:SpoIIE family protein phosphatase n=1 Tax=Oerskovia flava TaxID=2986422 RepID=UPI00223EBD74|nr:SpoIIE family protein phosphatase [Oerskovia sp. JB1-3-2]
MEDWFAAATHGTESGELARGVDWAATSLGDPSTWPRTLQVAVQMCFATRFPVMLVWGPELRMIYNDGYRPMLGSEKHHGAMGAPAREVWHEIWDDVGPLFDDVLRTGEPTWAVDQTLFMERSGYREETAFTFSYSALRDDEGAVRGVLDIATETTDQVVDSRRLHTLGRLSTTLHAQQGDILDLARATIDVLSDSVDVARTDLYLSTPEGLLLLASAPTGGTNPGVPDAAVAAVAERNAYAVVGPVVVAPLAGTRDTVSAGAIVLEATATRPLDDAYRSFLLLLASTVGTALSSTVAHLREVDDLQEVSDALQRAILPASATSPDWHTRYQPADDSLSVGGDWYDVVELGPGRWGLIVGDCVGHGLEAAACMGQLRSAGRALLLENHRPAETLAALDRFARTVPEARYATVSCSVVDTAAGTITYSSAGHPPGVVVRDGAVTWLDGGRGMPLTLGPPDRAEDVQGLERGDTVILYTDGLVERPGESIRAGLARLGSTVEAMPDECAPTEIADTLLRGLLPGGVRDDVALVIYRHPGQE